MFSSTSYKPQAFISTLVSRFPLRDEGATGVSVMLGGSILLSLILLLTDGNIVLGAGFVALLAVVLITFYRLDWGFYFFLASVLVFDNVNLEGFDPWTAKVGYMVTLNVLAPGLGVGALTPMEVHLLFIILVWVLLAAVKRNVHIQKVPLAIPAALFLVWLIVMTFYGVGTGGETMKAVWDIRAMLYLVILYFLVPQIITTREQLQNVLWICIGSMAIKAIQASIRFVESGFSFAEHRAMACHEDPIMMVPIFLLLLSMIFFKSRSAQRHLIWVLLIPYLVGFYAANRRAAYICFLVSVVAFVVLLTPRVRSRALKALIPLGIVFGMYLAVFWNSPSAQFAQAVKSAISKDPQSMRREDYLSGLARDQENYNLAVTFRRLPMGLGFGKKHDWAILNWGNFALRGYITHNQILWLLVKSGPVGFFLFLFFLNLVLFNGARVFSKLQDPYLMAVCAICIIAIPNQIVATYVDMGLARFRGMAYLGLLISLIPAIQHADGNGKTAKEIT